MPTMRSPHTGNPMRLVEGAVATYTLRGEQFQAGGPAWECPDTGERFTTDAQDMAVVEVLHQAWRHAHGIEQEQLRLRRKALGLSAAQASALLGLGTNQYRTYEQTNKLPSKSNATLLKLLLTREGVAALLHANEAALTAPARRKLLAHLQTTAMTPAFTKMYEAAPLARTTSFQVTVQQETGERTAAYSFAA